MLFKVLLCLCFLYGMVSAGYWTKIANNVCIGAKNSHYREFQYSGSSQFIIAMKLVHRKGVIGCSHSARSKWGCINGIYRMNTLVTDTRNDIIYPSPKLITLRAGAWYDLPGYGHNSPEIVFSDPGFRYLYQGQKMRIWYGEDLKNWHEGDNYGFSCMDVHVYVATI